jgi:hypothetical protein
MTKPFDVESDKEIPVPRAAGDARASESVAGADSAMSATRAFEGSHKQTADTNVEESLAAASLQAVGNSNFNEALLRANQKRTYDQAQSFDLMTQMGDVTQRATLNNLAVQAMQNAITTADMVAKQAVRHSDIAIDRQWNVDEQGIAAVIAAAVAAEVAKYNQK